MGMEQWTSRDTFLQVAQSPGVREFLAAAPGGCCEAVKLLLAWHMGQAPGAREWHQAAEGNPSALSSFSPSPPVPCRVPGAPQGWQQDGSCSITPGLRWLRLRGGHEHPGRGCGQGVSVLQ